MINIDNTDNMDFKLPDDFTDRVMDKIATETIARTERKEHIRNTWLTIFYSCAGVACLAVIIFTLNAFEVISIDNFKDSFRSIDKYQIVDVNEVTNNINALETSSKARMARTSAEMETVGNSIYESISSSIAGLSELFDSSQILVVIFFCVLMLSLFNKFLSARKTQMS
mgnify:CR=1 FL=1